MSFSNVSAQRTSPVESRTGAAYPSTGISLPPRDDDDVVGGRRLTLEERAGERKLVEGIRLARPGTTQAEVVDERGSSSLRVDVAEDLSERVVGEDDVARLHDRDSHRDRLEEPAGLLLRVAELLLVGVLLGDVTERQGDAVAHPHGRHVERPLEPRSFVPGDPRPQRLARLHDRGVASEIALAELRSEVAQPHADELALGVPERLDGSIGEVADEVDDRFVRVAHRAPDHEPVHHRLDRGTEAFLGRAEGPAGAELVGDVAERGDGADRRRVGIVDQRRRVDLDPRELVVGAADTHQEATHRPARDPRRDDGVLVVLDGGAVHVDGDPARVLRREADQLARGEPEDPLRGGVRVDDRPTGVLDDEAVVERVEHSLTHAIEAHATATPSKTAAFTPRRASSPRNAAGSTTAPRARAPRGSPRRSTAGSRPARQAALTARTVPAATAGRSITPYTTVSREVPRQPHTSTRAAPHPSSRGRRVSSATPARRTGTSPTRTDAAPERRHRVAQQLDTGRDHLALASAHRVGEPDELVTPPLRCLPGAVDPLDRRLASRTPERLHAGRARGADTGDVGFVDRVERVRRVAREHVAEPRDQAASHEDHDARPARGGVETEKCGDAVALVGDRGDGHARVDRTLGDRGPAACGHRQRNRVDVGGEGLVERDRVGNAPEGSREAARPVGVAIGDEQPVDAGSVDQLTGGACARGPRAHEQDGAHLKSGPSSSRHPPEVGVMRPLLRSLTTMLTRIASTPTSRPRRNVRTDRSVRVARVGGAAPRARRATATRQRVSRDAPASVRVLNSRSPMPVTTVGRSTARAVADRRRPNIGASSPKYPGAGIVRMRSSPPSARSPTISIAPSSTT